MIDDRKIWACAHQVMADYGEAAALHAALRADDLLATNDIEGSRTWMRIMKRIEDFESMTPKGTMH